MSNYAKINSENIVEHVIVSSPSYISELDGNFIEVTETTGWAGPNSLYSPNHNKFLSHKPFESWTLDEENFVWVAPKPKPPTGKWVWEDSIQEWVEVILTQTEE